jgi:hypothetical protein
MTKTIIGLTERILVRGMKSKRLVARIDTGAESSAIDSKLAAELSLGPVIKTKRIKSTHGETIRPVVVGEIVLAGKMIRNAFTIADRNHMKYKVLIGQDILCRNGFMIDPTKK